MRRRHHHRYQGLFTRLASLARSLASPAAAGVLLAGAAWLALSGALALPAAAQTTDPVWSTVMTVGTTGYGGHGYDVDEDEGGSLTDDDFEYSSATYTVTDVELDVFFGVSFGVLEEGLPEEDTLTLEIDGHAFPFEDRTLGEGGSALWVWAVPTGLDADDNADLPIGSQVAVCLRTATQVCPTEVPSALSVKDVSAEEGEDLIFTVELSPPSTETVTVDWATSGGTATSGTDFTAGTGTLTFTAGVTEQTFTVATIEDVTDQKNETFTVTLSNATNATISGATATGTIKDDDAPPLVAWSTVMTVAEVFGDPSHGYSENNGGELADADFQYDSATYTVEGIYVTRFGGVSFRVDKSGLPQDEILTLVIDGHEFPFEDRRDNSGASLWEWAVPEGLNDPVNDLPVGESVVVCLRNGTGVCPARALTVTDVSAEEGEDLTFTATLWQASTETVTVDWATSEGTATSGTDFTAGTETLTFTAGVTEQTVTVATIEDMTDEDHETFTVTLSNPTSGTITGAPATGIIVDDDGTSPLWSATMTVGDTQIGGHGYQEKGRGGSLSDDDFAYGLTATTYTTYVVEAVLVDADFGVSFLVDIDPAGVPLDNTLTLEIGGHEFPVEDRNAFSSSTFLYWAVPAALDDLETEFPVGSTATVCLRTAAQVCPSGSIVTPTTDPVWSTTMTAGDTPGGHGYDRTDLDAPTIGALDDDNFDYGSSSYGVLAIDVATNAVRFVVAESGLPTNEILTLELGGHALAFSDRHNAISGQSRWYWTVPAALDDLETEFPVGSTATVCLRTATQVCPTGSIVTPPVTPPPNPTLSVGDAAGTEGGDVTFTATLSATATADVMATWTASIESGDTAVLADLGTTTTGPVMVTAGQTTGTFMVPTAPDATNEGNETFTVTLSSVSSNAQLAADATATGTIVNDDQPTVGFKEESVIVLEGAAIISFLVELDEASTLPITVDWETRAGSAEADVDYTAASGTLTFAAGDTEETITVALIDDAIHEENLEEFTVHLSGTDDALVTLGRSSVLGRIIDRDRATITVAEETTVDEDAGTVTLTLTASASASAAYMIDYATENGTAEAGTDYTAASGQVTFPAEETEQTITITVLDDAADEDREDFKVRLSNATAQRIDLPADPARVLIEDNDDPPTVTVADGTATEGDKVEFTVTLSALSGLDVEVDYATTETDPQSAVSGTDFTAASGTLEIEAGNRTGTIEVQTTEDDASESAETFTLTISNPDNATLGAKVAATGTINDDANAAPTFSSSATFDAAENQTTAGTVLATDGDTGDDVTGYAITGGADQSFFSIGTTSGALTFDDEPNFEDAEDQGTNNTYVVTVEATSGTGTREKTATQTITVTVTDVAGEAPGKPDAPDVAAASVTSLTVSWSAPANAGPAIDDYDVQYREGTTGNWSDGNHTGTATTATLSGLSENTSYQVQVRATNDEGTGAWSDSGSGTTDANAAPSFSSPATFDAAENQTTAGTVVATDSDTGDDVTGYAITGGADASFFSIGATSGALTFQSAPNYEDAKDQGSNNTYVVEVQATSGTDEREKTATQTITVTVTDVSGEAPGKPDAPAVSPASVTSLTVNWSAPSNAGPAITDYDVQYREGTSGDWTDGGHNGTAVTATLTGLSENTSYQVQVRATNDEGTGAWSDSGSDSTDANAAPAFSSDDAFEAAENQRTAGTVLATDSDADDDVTGYAITGGADEALFEIGATDGALTFKTAPNYEDAKDIESVDPANAAGNNQYVVVVTATSGADEREKTATQTITVTVTDVDTEAPGKPAAPTVSPASVTSLTVTWTAPTNAGPVITDYDVQYREGNSGGWSDGGHNGTAVTATLTGLSENTSHQVQVRATNDEATGDWSDSGSGATDANAAPAFSSPATFDAAENQTTAGTVLATDSDAGDDVTGYAIMGGADQAFFTIGATDGALTFKTAPNFEDAKDIESVDPANAAGNNQYMVVVQATSGADEREKTATQTITVTVTDVAGEAPGKPNVPMVSAASVSSLTVNWTAPPNAGPAITDYDVQYREGTSGDWSDAGHAGTAVTATLTGLSENTSYQVQVRATNDEATGDWSDSGSGTTDANAAPAFTSDAEFDAAENQTAAGTVLATDSDTKDDITGYAITGGADRNLFSIGATSGTLTFDDAPNFEAPSDANTDNDYVVEVQATSGADEREKTATQTITVTVTDVAGEAPGKPNAPMVSAASVSSLSVNWSAPSNAGPAITGYDVQYREGNSGDWSDAGHTGTAVTATLTGLSENTSYQVQVRATNAEGTGDWSDSGSGATDVNAAPAFSSSATFDAAENQTTAGTVLATDSDTGDDVTGYAITGGADQALFSIGATDGALAFKAAPNFEDAQDIESVDPANAAGNNQYVVVVTATSGTDEREKTATQTITVTVTDVSGEAPGKPDAPAVSAASVTSLSVNWSAPANAGPAITDYDYRHRTTSPEGTWTEVTGTTITTLSATIGSLAENTSYDVQVRATNDEGTGDWSDSGSGTTDANAAPAFSSDDAFEAAENQTTAGTVLATDSDSDDDVTGYAITGGADEAFFTIGATDGALTFKTAPNYEDAKDIESVDPANAAGNNQYVVVVTATSGTDEREKTATQTITVTVTDVSGEAPGKPDAPAVSAASVTSLSVNWSAPANAGPAITDYDYRHRTTSPEGTWTEVTGTTITTLSATIGSLAENTSYDVQVRATNAEGTGAWSDSGSGTTDANAAPSFSSPATFDAAENQTTAGTVRASDSDAGDDITGYAITGGADRNLFSIGATSGTLTFDDAPNFEAPSDANTDNDYVVEVQATSGADEREKTATQTITVTVTDVAGEAPGKPAAPAVAAASVSSLTVNWTAPPNAGPAITDYDVQYREGTSGDWSDAGHAGTAVTATLTGLSENTSYQVQVRATNAEGTGDWSDSGSGATDVNAAPAFSSPATFDAAENQTTAGTVLATDSDAGDDITGYAITGGADRNLFSIGATSGTLTFDDAPNFEAPSDANTDNDYVVEVQATSGADEREKTATQTITVTVTDVSGEAPGKPDAPAVSAASATSLSVNWSAPSNAGPAITGYDVQYREGNSGDWSDAGHTGTAVTATLTGLSENTSYQVQVRATNDEGTGAWSDSGSGRTDANAAPSFSSSATFDAAENQTVAGTVLATDSDAGDDVTGYAITGGADQTFFSIGATSGALSFDAAPNYEDAKDQGSNNTYVVEVTATSGAGTREKTATQTITVTVTDVSGEAPGKPNAPAVSAASASSLTVNWSAPSNAGPVITDYDYRHRTTSPEGTWTEVTGTTITTLSATIGSLEENTSYDVQVRATNDEGTGSWSDSGSGRTDANAAPSFSSSATFDAAENQTVAGTVLATDGDTDDDVTGYAITGGADQTFFSIGATSGALSFDAAPNYEDAKDQGSNNTYVVEVTATSGAGEREKTATQTITVTVTDDDTEAPGKPAAPTVSPASVTSLTVTWTAPSNAGPAITDYDVQYRAGASGDWSDGGHAGTAVTATLTGLSENTSYQVQVRATNDEGTGDWSDSGSGATDANAAPAFSSPATFDAAENQTTAGTVLATDSDAGDDITGYAITGGADQAFFTIGATSGTMTFDDAPNFEAPSDANTDNTYVVEVTATSGAGEREKTATQTITVTVTDVSGEAPGKPDAPAVSAASATSLSVNWSAPSNAGPAITDYDVQYREGTSGGWTDGNYNGTATTATLTGLSEDTSHQVQVRATNAEGTGSWSDSGSGATDANAAPAFSSSATFDAAENQTAAGTVVASDSDSEDKIERYDITGGADQALFMVIASSGDLEFRDAPNYEDAKDQDTNNTYVVEVQATSGAGTREKTATQTITVTVTDVSGEAPGKPNAPTVSPASVTSLTVNWSAPSNAGPAITDYDVQYRAGTSGDWSDGGHAGTATTATLTGLSENTSHQVQVRATNAEGTGSWSDSGSGATDANAAPAFSSSATFDAAENQTAAGTVVASDSDSEDKIERYDITGGADQALFMVIASSGDLEFRVAPNYEDAKDQDTNNTYVVEVQATSGVGTREKTATQTITVTVTDVNTEAPGKPDAPAVAAASVTSLTVNWSAPSNAGPAITDYDVQYRAGTSGDWTDGGHAGTATTATLTGLSENTSHQVQVRATNAEGTGAWSDSGSGMTVTPLTVEMTSGAEPPVSGPFTVRFSFSEPVTGFSGSDIETQQDPACRDDLNNPVVCDPGIGGLETTDDRVFTTTVTPWTDRVAHSYTLTLTVGGGAVRSSVGSKPNEEPEEPLEVRVSPPGAPEPISTLSLGANGANGSVRLSWNRPSDNGGSPIIRYEYRYAATGEAWSRWENAAAGSSGVTVGGLINGREYVFEVRAVNALGKGGAETVRATPERRIAPPRPPPPPRPPGNGDGGGLLFPPEAPAGLMAMPGEGAVRLEWSPPESDGGTPILRHEYRLKEGLGEFGEWTPIADSAPGEVNASGYTVGGLFNGTVYAFELRAVNLVGEGRVSEPVEVVMLLDRVYWSNFRGEELQGSEASLEHTPFGGTSQSLRLRFGAGLRFEESELEGEVTGTRAGSYGYRYTSRTTGELRLDYDGGDSCELRLTFRGVGAGSYSYRCGGRLGGQGSFRLSGLNRAPEITGAGVFEVAENRAVVGRLEAMDPDEGDGIEGYGIAGGADASLFVIEAETGELRFREAPDYETPGDVESAEPASGAGDNEYIVVVEVSSGEGERERKGSRVIRVRVSDEEEPPEITSVGLFEVMENRTRVGRLEAVDPDEGDEIREYGIAGGADGGLFAVAEETGELLFREAPDYENPGDVESAKPASGAGDNEYIVVVEVRSGEGERERMGSRAIRVRVTDEEEPPEAPAAPAVTAEGSGSLKVSWREPENRGPEIMDYEVRYREAGEAGYSDRGHQGTGLEVRLSGLKEGTSYEVQVRAVNEEGMSEWSEPGEGRTDTEEADPDDPSDFSGEELEGRRLTLRQADADGTRRSLELRFGEGNRFEQIESGGQEAATRSEGASRSGSYSYEKTGPGRGTVRLDYDDGSFCEIRLSFTGTGAGGFAYDCGGGDQAEGSFRLTTGSLFVPVILSAAGQNQSLFTSELTLTNRGEREARLHYTYTAHIGGGSGRASDVLAPGMQKIATDALVYLRSLGIAIPETGNRIGTLRVEARLGSEVEAVVRTTTAVVEGRAGLAYPGVAAEEGFQVPVYLCGLRQNGKDRSNLAFQNMGAPEEGAITMRTTVYSGESGDTSARVLEDVKLEPGGFHQYSGLLGVLGVPAQGYVRVERVEGRAPFYAYGVINDQANSDGSFVFPVAASSLEGRMGQTLPVIVETSAFRSELTVTNFSGEARTLQFSFVADGVRTPDHTADFSLMPMRLEAGEQRIIPDIVAALRQQGVEGIGLSRGFYTGAVFATAVEGDMSGIVIGARTGSEGGGGQYSVFYNAVPVGAAFSEVAWIDALQQNGENRSNLALVNTGEVDDSVSVFHLEIYDGETGMLVTTIATRPIPARGWHQINGILGSYAPETRQGYIRIMKVSGANPFLAYGVVNDGGAPGERSGDGAYLPARE